jgi:hypothetical protein
MTAKLTTTKFKFSENVFSIFIFPRLCAFFTQVRGWKKHILAQFSVAKATPLGYNDILLETAFSREDVKYG